VSRPPLVGGTATLGGNLALALVIHPSKATPTIRPPARGGALAMTRRRGLPRPRGGSLRPRLGRPRLARAGPFRRLGTLLDALVLSLSLRTGTTWHLILPSRTLYASDLVSVEYVKTYSVSVAC
jgi:hypothetical protein